MHSSAVVRLRKAIAALVPLARRPADHRIATESVSSAHQHSVAGRSSRCGPDRRRRPRPGRPLRAAPSRPRGRDRGVPLSAGRAGRAAPGSLVAARRRGGSLAALRARRLRAAIRAANAGVRGRRAGSTPRCRRAWRCCAGCTNSPTRHTRRGRRPDLLLEAAGAAAPGATGACGPRRLLARCSSRARGAAPRRTAASRRAPARRAGGARERSWAAASPAWLVLVVAHLDASPAAAALAFAARCSAAAQALRAAGRAARGRRRGRRGGLAAGRPRRRRSQRSRRCRRVLAVAGRRSHARSAQPRLRAAGPKRLKIGGRARGSRRSRW